VSPAHLGAGENYRFQRPREVVLQGRVFEKLLLYIGPVKAQAQYIVLNYQMLMVRPKLLYFLGLIARRQPRRPVSVLVRCKKISSASFARNCNGNGNAFSQRQDC